MGLILLAFSSFFLLISLLRDLLDWLWYRLTGKRFPITP
jgi:hypothetical protein